MSDAPLLEKGYGRNASGPKRWVIPVLIVLIIALAAAVITLGVFLGKSQLPEALGDAVTADNVLLHLKELERIAYFPQNKGSRAVMLGYNDSGEYIISRLKSLNICDYSTQEFVVPVWEEKQKPTLQVIAPYVINLQENVEFRNMRYGGSGSLNATVRVLPPNGKCYNTTQEYIDAGLVRGEIVLVQDNSCDLFTRAYAAEQAGAAAFLNHNSANTKTLSFPRVRIVEWKEGDPLVSIPSFTVSYAFAETVKSISAQGSPVRLLLNATNQLDVVNTFNVICETKEGSKDSEIVVGAHLDSVPEGPGINDDGSGSAIILEIVTQMDRLKAELKNKVTFAWFGAEEIGLLGSRHMVRLWNQTGRLAPVKLMMNQDMLASPNYINQVHNSADSLPSARTGSQAIEKKLIESFDRNKTPYVIVPMVSGSDFLPFLNAGIPTGGVKTGASEIKSIKDREIFGGFSNAQLDTCYHLACDTYLNINKEALAANSRATAETVLFFATQEDLGGYLEGYKPKSAAIVTQN